MAVNFDSLDRVRLFDTEKEYLIKIGFSEDIIDEFKTQLEFFQFLFVRDLFETAGLYDCERKNVLNSAFAGSILALMVNINRGSTAVALDDESAAAIASLDPDNGLFGGIDTPLVKYRSGDTEYICFSRHYTASRLLSGRISKGRLQKYEALLSCCDGGREKYDSKQQEIIAECPQSGIYIITGGPGTGKTTVLSGILYTYIHNGGCVDDIALAAPTGRAAVRMKESLNKEFEVLNRNLEDNINIASLKPSTIHSLLDYRPQNNSFDKNKQIDYKLIVADEFSMAAPELAAALFGAVDEEALLIIVGDPNQLPSVEAGNVLVQLTKTYKDSWGQLETNYRSQENIKRVKEELEKPGDIDIISLMETKNNIGEMFDDWYKDYISSPQACEDMGYVSACFVPTAYETAAALSKEWFETAFCRKYYTAGGRELSYIDLIKELSCVDFDKLEDCEELLKLLFKAINKFKLLCCFREGAFGLRNMNSNMNKLLKKHLNGIGVPMMITRNNHNIGLYNGDTGVLIKGKYGSEGVVFEQEKDGRTIYKAFSRFALPFREAAFAITVHKSQGSEYEHELILIPEMTNESAKALLCNEILYTAVTRAKRSLCIAGDREALEYAMSNRLNRIGIPIN